MGQTVAVVDGRVADYVEAARPLDNVITRLSFDESLDLEKFAGASQEAALSDLNRRLMSSAPDGLVIAVNSLQLAETGVNMVVSISKDGQKLLQEGVAVISRTASERTLPVIRGVKDGRILEMMKEARGAQALGRLASLGAVVVGAAHIISGADIARRLKAVDAKIDLLLAYRKIDQMSALERIYTSARELCRGEVTKEKQWELWKMRGELRELRTRWRREMRHEIELVKDPNQRDWFRNIFGWIEPVDKGPHQETHQKITERQPHLMLIEYSLRLDQSLAVASDTVPEFETTLEDELRGLEDVRVLLKNKADLISKKYPDLTVQPTLDGMSVMLEGYSKLLPETASERCLEP
ncbi:MAG: hypothetical protein PHC88_00295 [Terrimicrobiaceae bacterium]|nr:hypothetical protein [Terrimicrobiaceae bacterium]